MPVMSTLIVSHDNCCHGLSTLMHHEHQQDTVVIQQLVTQPIITGCALVPDGAYSCRAASTTAIISMQ